jgi:type IV pilus assembly protein PilA
MRIDFKDRYGEDLMLKAQGFSLLELLIAALIISTLAAIAYPAYQNFSRRLIYAELLKSTEPIKTSVSACYKTQKSLIDCDSGKNHIAKNIKPDGLIQSVTVQDGVITIVPAENKGILRSDNYVLTPIVKDGEIQWKSSGKAIENAYAS